ncbi:uncharacterized protein ccdc160 isoform X2 [Paramormyrops kingsleyae]|uniref:uncharacterized protein ccdc160 isoform X2 n=1 Tax=Paramormyrops kingsleyae TaxID=1676925 RepID=UPI003B97BAF2
MNVPWLQILHGSQRSGLDSRTIKDLLENAGTRAGMGSVQILPTERLSTARGSHRKEIYQSALEEVQKREEQRRRQRLADRIVRKDEEKLEMPRDMEHRGVASTQTLAEEKEGRYIWNQKDLVTLRWAVREVERDRRRLSARLQLALAQAEAQRGERRRLQGLLDEREAQLALASREAAWQSQRVEALRVQAREREAHLEAWAAELRGKAEEVSKVRERLRRAEEEARELRAEKADLAHELEVLKRHLEAERQGREMAGRAEHDTALQELQEELEVARAELEAERQRHAHSRMALDVLRRHCDGQSEPWEHRLADEITYM